MTVLIIRFARLELRERVVLYFSALINADGLDGFVMCGPGTIDGNGMRSWKAFWLRRSWNPKCTNKDEQRPRLVYLSNCKNVLIADLNLQNSHFWTTHLYHCDHVKYLNCRIFHRHRLLRRQAQMQLTLMCAAIFW